MVSCCWLASLDPSPLIALATAPATAAGAASQATEGGSSLVDNLLMGGLLAWLVFAIVALVKLDVFRAKPLRTAPPRTSAAFLPVAFGTFVLYFAFLTIAIGVGVSLHLFSTETFGGKAAETGAATMAATNPGIKTPSEIAAEADLQKSVEQMRAQSVVIGAELAACACALVLARLLTVDRLKGLGLHLQQLPWGLVLGALGYLLVFPLLYLDNIIVTQLYLQAGHDPTVHETVKEIQKTSSFDVRLIFALVAGLGAPIAEEFFFRGLLQTALIQRGWGIIINFPPDKTYLPRVSQRWAAILICSTLFSLLHNIDHMPILFLLSVGLGYLYERTGNLWACITLHAVFNWWTLVLVLISG